MQQSPAAGIDQPGWHPAWKRYAAFGNRAVVKHNYVSGNWYVIKGTPDVPGQKTVYAGPSEEAADALFDSLAIGWLLESD